MLQGHLAAGHGSARNGSSSSRWLVMVAMGKISRIRIMKSLSAGRVSSAPDLSSLLWSPTRSSYQFGEGDMELIISVTSPRGGAQGSEGARAVGTDIAGRLQESPDVADVDAGMDRAAACCAVDGQQGRQDRTDCRGHHMWCSSENVYISTRLGCSPNGLSIDSDGVTVRAGGEAILYVQINGEKRKKTCSSSEFIVVLL